MCNSNDKAAIAHNEIMKSIVNYCKKNDHFRYCNKVIEVFQCSMTYVMK